MKILQVIDGRCCDAIRTFIIQQSRVLINLGEEVVILDNQGKITFGKIELNENERELISSLSSLIRFPLNVFKFAELVKKIEPDIVVVHQGESHFVAAFAVWKSNTKIPVIRFRWDNRPRQGISSPAKFVSNHLTAGIAVPTRIAANYVSAKLKPKKLEIFYPAVDSDYFKPTAASNRLKDKYKISHDNIVIAMMGNLNPMRGHRIFIEAAKLVTIRYPKARFLISGIEKSVKLDHLKVLTDKLRISDKFMYISEVDDVRKIYSLCHIGVIATIGYEPISRILLEFISMGIPVISTNLNQAKDILENTDVLIPPGEPVILADKIGELMDHPELRTEFARKGLTVIANYHTMERLGKHSQAFFGEIIDGKN